MKSLNFVWLILLYLIDCTYTASVADVARLLLDCVKEGIRIAFMLQGRGNRKGKRKEELR